VAGSHQVERNSFFQGCYEDLVHHSSTNASGRCPAADGNQQLLSAWWGDGDMHCCRRSTCDCDCVLPVFSSSHNNIDLHCARPQIGPFARLPARQLPLFLDDRQAGYFSVIFVLSRTVYANDLPELSAVTPRRIPADRNFPGNLRPVMRLSVGFVHLQTFSVFEEIYD